jgi:hypothetical protein
MMSISKRKSSFRCLNISSIQNIIVQQAIYIVFYEIYENELKYFSEKSYAFRANKFFDMVFKEIKFG